MEPWPKDHPSYEIVKGAARLNPAKWNPFLQPEDRAPEPADAKAALRQQVARTKLPCVHLSDRLPGQPCGSSLYRCKKYGDVTARTGNCLDAARSCVTCPDYSTAGVA